MSRYRNGAYLEYTRVRAWLLLLGAGTDKFYLGCAVCIDWWRLLALLLSIIVAVAVIIIAVLCRGSCRLRHAGEQ